MMHGQLRLAINSATSRYVTFYIYFGCLIDWFLRTRWDTRTSLALGRNRFRWIIFWAFVFVVCPSNPTYSVSWVRDPHQRAIRQSLDDNYSYQACEDWVLSSIGAISVPSGPSLILSSGVFSLCSSLALDFVPPNPTLLTV